MTDLVIALPGGALDLMRRQVVRQGVAAAIEPRAWRVLERLARFRHRVVTTQEMLAALRPEGGASPAALRQAIRAARRAIGDDGNEPIIRTVPRVGYILDVPRSDTGGPPMAPSRSATAIQLLIGSLHNATGRPELRWVEHGLAACIAHGLSLSARLQVQEAPALDVPRDPVRQHIRAMVRACGARFTIAGSLAQTGTAFELTLTIHDMDDAEEATLQVRAATVAGLVVPAIQALHHHLLGARRLPASVAPMRRCSELALELFSLARQSAAEQSHVAALRAFELLHIIEPDFPRLELELLRVQAICGSDDGPARAALLLQAAIRDGDAALEAQTQQSLATLHHVKGRLREAALSLQQALQVGRRCMPPDWLGRNLTLLASVECRLGEMHSVRTNLDEAQAIFMRIGSHFGMLNVLWLRAVMSSLSGNVEQAIQWNVKLVNGARRFRARTTLVNACLNLAGDLIHADRLEEARPFAEEASATALAIESDVNVASFVANVHCLLHRLQGRPDAAAELLSQLPRPADIQDEGYLWQAHGHAALAAGRAAEAAECFLRSAAELRLRGNLAGEAPLLPWLVEALVRCDRLSTAQAELDRASAQPHLQGESSTANLLYARALLARRCHRHTEAAALLEQLVRSPAALPLFRRLGRDLSRAPGVRQDAHVPHEPPNGDMRRQFRFASCMLDVERREFWIDGRHRTLAPKPFDVLVHLYRNRHRVVDASELLETVWDGDSGSPEMVAQAIARIRQVVRRSSAASGLIQTVYGKGYRLLAHPRAEPDDSAAASLLSELPAAHEPLLALVPLASRGVGAGGIHPDIAYQLELLGHSLAVHARMRRLPAVKVREMTAGIEGSRTDAIVDAIHARSPDATVLLATLTRRDRLLTVEYLLASSVGRTCGTVRGASPTALGRQLAARLARSHSSPTRALPGHAKAQPWVTRVLGLAAAAVQGGHRNTAIRMLQVILDQDPDNDLAFDLHARLATPVDDPDRRASTIAVGEQA
ncbi:winged helix-turn-helix domain-containing protein [Variovorax sp. YR752]|uniref:winged helix-turn-helix domain-containing protein n=1 Tax=Variovorax sp. YR752 TaxID=1884383 RepID=UPI003137BC81